MLGLLYINKIPHPMNAFPAHKHDFWEIVYYTNGSGQLFIEDQLYYFEPMDIYCIPPDMTHSEQTDDGFQNVHIWIRSFPGFPNIPIRFHDTLSQDFYSILMRIYNEFLLKRNNWTNIIESLLDALYQYIISWDSEKGHPMIERMKNRIISNLSNPDYQIKDSYRDIPMSADHLRRLFKEHTGKNPLEYLNELRIEYAKNLLEYIYPDGLTIKEISSMCGFSDPYYFSRAFKKITGKSPTHWMKN